MPPAKAGGYYSTQGLRKFLDVIASPNTKEIFFTGTPSRTPKRAAAIGGGLRVKPPVVPAEELNGRRWARWRAEDRGQTEPISMARATANSSVATAHRDFKLPEGAVEERELVVVAARSAFVYTRNFREGGAPHRQTRQTPHGTTAVARPRRRAAFFAARRYEIQYTPEKGAETAGTADCRAVGRPYPRFCQVA